jgi:hypothetical protein
MLYYQGSWGMKKVIKIEGFRVDKKVIKLCLETLINRLFRDIDFDKNESPGVLKK